MTLLCCTPLLSLLIIGMLSTKVSSTQAVLEPMKNLTVAYYSSENSVFNCTIDGGSIVWVIKSTMPNTPPCQIQAPENNATCAAQHKLIINAISQNESQMIISPNARQALWHQSSNGLSPFLVGCFSTGSGSWRDPDYPQYYVSYRCDEPLNPPSNLSLSYISGNEVQLTWSEPVVPPLCNDPLTYEIQVTQLSATNPKVERFNTSTSNQSFTYSVNQEIKVCTEFHFTVVATSAVSGYSTEVFISKYLPKIYCLQQTSTNTTLLPTPKVSNSSTGSGSKKAVLGGVLGAIVILFLVLLSLILIVVFKFRIRIRSALISRRQHTHHDQQDLDDNDNGTPPESPDSRRSKELKLIGYKSHGSSPIDTARDLSLHGHRGDDIINDSEVVQVSQTDSEMKDSIRKNDPIVEVMPSPPRQTALKRRVPGRTEKDSDSEYPKQKETNETNETHDTESQHSDDVAIADEVTTEIDQHNDRSIHQKNGEHTERAARRIVTDFSEPDYDSPVETDSENDEEIEDIPSQTYKHVQLQGASGIRKRMN